jgi:hypothetical protein
MRGHFRPLDAPLPRPAQPRVGRYTAKRSALNGREADLNEAASAADAWRDTIWQGNCDVGHQQLCNNIAPIRNTIPIQYPISNCPAKKASFKSLYRKRAGRRVCYFGACSSRRASDTALRLIIPNPFCTRPAPMTRTGALQEILVCSRDSFPVDPAQKGVAADSTLGNCSAT